MTHTELAWEFAELFAQLEIDQINELLVKNVPAEVLRFFQNYAADFADARGVDRETRERLPNLMLLGYLLRVLEERLLDGEPPLPAS